MLSFCFFFTTAGSISCCQWAKWKGQKEKEDCKAYTVRLFVMWDWQHKICMSIHMLSLFFHEYLTPHWEFSMRLTLSNGGKALSAVSVSPFPWLSINHRFWQAESKDMNFKSQLDWNRTNKKTKNKNFIGHLTQNKKEQSRTGREILIVSHREVWRVQVHVNMDLCIYSLAVQMSGLLGGEGYRFKLTAAVQRCCLKVTGRLYASSQNNLDFMFKWHRLQAKNAFVSNGKWL